MMAPDFFMMECDRLDAGCHMGHRLSVEDKSKSLIGVLKFYPLSFSNVPGVTVPR